MQKMDLDTSGRTLRWYEWLMFLLLFALIGGVRAAPVYKCTDAQGAVAYQTNACAVAMHEKVIEIAPSPPVSPIPDYGVDRGDHLHSSSTRRPTASYRARVTSAPATSYECRAADGQVFYRHTPCPHSIAAMKTNKNSRHGASTAKTVSVNSTRISRDEACTQLRRAGSIGRNGHDHDQDVSTYDKNLGRDPCR